MPFAIGDHVHVHSLGKGIVREVRKGGRCLVEIKGRALLVEERQLALVDERRPRAQPGRDEAHPEPPGPNRGQVPDRIDLHGLTTSEAVTALDGFISEAILGGLAEVRVIHGRSGGRLKAAVHSRLRSMPSIRGFRIDPGNAGVTIVVF